MPLILGPSAVGIVPVGDGSLADLEKLIPNPDKLRDAGSTGHHLDEMSPAAAVQLRIEINKYLATNGEPGTTTAYGTYTVTAADVIATVATVNTGVDTEDPLTTLMVIITRAGTIVTSDAVITDGEDGTFTVEDGGATYVLTADDVIEFYAAV